MKKQIDAVGKKYGKLLVLEEISSPIISKQKYRKTLLKLKCQCECGNIIIVFKGNVLYGKTKQCVNCQNSNITIGEKIGSLTIISRIYNEGPRKYLCKCDCGFEDIYRSWFLQHAKKICCKNCRFPKKPKKTRTYLSEEINYLKTIKAQRLVETNYLKHIRSKKDKIGKKNGRLKIVGFSHWEQKGNRRRAYYKAKCKCGNEVVVRDCFAVKSCGCLQRESIPKGENSYNAKFTASQVKAIREFKKSNLYTGKQIANIFSVDQTVISSIIKGKTYKEK